MNTLPSQKSTIDPRLELDSESFAEATAKAFPVVSAQVRGNDRAGLVFGAGIAMLLGALTLFGMTASRSGATPTQVPPVPAQSVPPVEQETGPQTVLAPVAMSGAVSPVTDMPVMPMAPSIPLAPVVPATEGQRAPALVYDTPGEPNDTAAAMANAVTQADPARGAARTAALDTLSPDEQFVRRLAGESTSASATPMVSPGSTIAQGTLVAAVLETSLNSDLPGYVRAVISREVRSFDGRRVLIPRGSHVIGEYKSGLAVGQTRAFVLWTRLLRPDGVSVALGSPATDTAGSNGLLGKVNSHFGKRFGAAMLMSLISAGGQAIGGGGAVIIASPSQAASNAVQRDINIPPTVRVAAGTPIRIFVTRDLDFSGVEGQ